MEYDFTLKFRLTELALNGEEIAERLGAGGCDDALVGIGTPGRVGLHFTREGRSAEAAVQSALADVRRALPGARLLEAGPDYVGLSDVADLLGFSRQNLRKLMLTHASSFPPPVHDGSTAVWHLAPLLAWLGSRDYEIDPAMLEVARATMTINLLRETAAVRFAVRRQLQVNLKVPGKHVVRTAGKEARVVVTSWQAPGGRQLQKHGRKPFVKFIERYLHG